MKSGGICSWGFCLIQSLWNIKNIFKPIKIDVSFAVSDVSLDLHEPQNPCNSSISYARGFMVGNSRTSRMLSELVSSITKRSKPKPRPPEIALTGYQRGGRPVITGFFAFLPRVFPPAGVPFFSL